jgi:hypothetical protein
MQPLSDPGRRLAVLALALSCASAAAPGAPAAADPASARPAWRRVLIADDTTAAAVRGALSGAGRRLEEPRCQAVFSDPELRDAGGRPLQEKLDALGTQGPGYLALLVFVDGRALKTCQAAQTLAFTAPGARVVYVCGRRFWDAWTRDPDFAEAAVIHEALHTLGLGENPPSPQAITATVRAYCER